MSFRLVAHKIEKSKGNRNAKPILRSELNAASEAAERFMPDLKASISRGNPKAGIFKQPVGEQPPLQRRIMRYMKERTDAAFLDFSRECCKLLLNKMSEEPGSTGGYIVFAEYTHGGDEFMIIAILSTQAKSSFDEELNLQSTSILDLEHLRHGARIRYSGVEVNDEGVAQFISKKRGDVSGYFLDFLDCEQVTDSSAQGRSLYSSLRDLSITQKRDRDHLMQTAFYYYRKCCEKREDMNLMVLCRLLDPAEPDSVFDFLSDPSRGLAGEFPPPPSAVMKNFKKFAYADKSFRIEFDREDWLSKIDVKGSTITIKDAPDALKRQILEDKA